MKKITLTILVILMISLAVGLFGKQINTLNREQMTADMIRSMRFVPRPSPVTSSRTVALTEYVEQDYWAEWDNVRKIAVGYDTDMRIQRLLSSFWNWDGEWEVSTNEVATYRPDGKPLQVIQHEWYGTEWIPGMQVNFSWDGDQLQSILHQLLDGEEAYTVMTQEFTYNDVTQRLEYITSIMEWLDFREWTIRVYLDWDANGRVDYITLSMFDVDYEAWFPVYKTYMTYHPQDQSNYQTFMDFLTAQLTFGNHDLNHMSSQIKVIEELEYAMTEEEDWMLESKYEYNYDTNLRLTQVLESWYDSEEWILTAQEDFAYDGSGNLIEWLFSDVWYESVDPYHRRLYTYSEVSSNPNNVTNPPTAILNVYPNPFNPQTTIYFDLAKTAEVEIEIYNLKGQKVRSLINEVKTAGKHQIVWNGTNDRGNIMSSGMYFVRMKSGKDIVSRKIILQK